LCLPEADPAHILIVRAEEETLQQVISALPCWQREVIVLKHIEDLSYQEIAASLRIPVGTVMSRLSRARTATCRRIKQAARDRSPRDGSWNKSLTVAVFASNGRTTRARGGSRVRAF
jgi:predicted DNA-binding protein (UPF0251 family)